jgi:hypothetical protein
MEVGVRKQQGRVKKGKEESYKFREQCPACKKYYLKTLYFYENGKKVKFGMGCPNTLCTFCRKDVRKKEN